ARESSRLLGELRRSGLRPATSQRRSPTSMPVCALAGGEEGEQRGEVFFPELLEARGHDGQLRGLERGDVLPLHGVLLPGEVVQLDARLRLGVEPAGQRVAA